MIGAFGFEGADTAFPLGIVARISGTAHRDGDAMGDQQLLVGSTGLSSLDDLQSQLSALVLPNSPQLIEAGEQLQSLGQLWRHMTLAEQREVTRVILKGVYVDTDTGFIVAIEPVPVFRFILTQACENVGVKVL